MVDDGLAAGVTKRLRPMLPGCSRLAFRNGFERHKSVQGVSTRRNECVKLCVAASGFEAQEALFQHRPFQRPDRRIIDGGLLR